MTATTADEERVTMTKNDATVNYPSETTTLLWKGQQQLLSSSSSSAKNHHRAATSNTKVFKQPKQAPNDKSIRQKSFYFRCFVAALTILLLAIAIPKLGRQPPQSSSQHENSFHNDAKSSSSSSGAYAVHHWDEEEANDNQNNNVKNDCQPRRIHLAQASNVKDDSNGTGGLVNMTVSFMLDYNNKACQPDKVRPRIVYGQGFHTKDSVTANKPPLQFNYTSVRSNGIFQSDYIYHVVVPNLLAGQEQYWYRILVEQQPQQEPSFSSNQTRPRQVFLRTKSITMGHQHRRRMLVVGQTETFRFSTPPLSHQPTSIALVGDLGQTVNSTRTMRHIWRAASQQTNNNNNNNKEPEMLMTSIPPPISHVLIAGDMSYADADPLRWTSWFDIMEPLFRKTPLHVAAGNHEIECDNTTKEIFVPYEHYFSNPNRVMDQAVVMEPVKETYRQTLSRGMPWQGDCTTPSEFVGVYDYGNSFYSYRHGLVHVVVLNSYTSSLPGSAQYRWLQHELQTAVNRRVTPWLLVAFHAPLYTTFLGHVGERQATQMRLAMEPLFVQYKVNLVVSGHDHAYMRSRSMAYGRVDETAKSPVYLILGAGGNREQHAGGYQHEDAPERWVAARSLHDYGYGHLHCHNATHAHWKWVRDGISRAGIQDVVWLHNPHAAAAS